MPEHMEWAIRVVPVEEGVWHGDLMYFEGWEPFEVRAGFVWLRKEVMIEDEKSSVHHELSFAQRFPDDNHPED